MREVSNKTTLRQRAIQICDYYHISPNKLSEDSGHNRNYISRLGNTMSFEFMIHIYRNYELINLDWLLSGNGNMLVPDCDEKINSVLVVDMLHDALEKNKQLELENQRLKDKLHQISQIISLK